MIQIPPLFIGPFCSIPGGLLHYFPNVWEFYFPQYSEFNLPFPDGGLLREKMAVGLFTRYRAVKRKAQWERVLKLGA